MCYVVRPMVVVSVLNMERHFLSLFPEQYSITTIYIAFTLVFLKTLFILFLGRGEEEGKEGENHQCVVASHMVPTGDPACTPGMCPNMYDYTEQPRSSRLSSAPWHPDKDCTWRCALNFCRRRCLRALYALERFPALNRSLDKKISNVPDSSMIFKFFF